LTLKISKILCTSREGAGARAPPKYFKHLTIQGAYFRVLTTLENLENSGNFLILENSGNFKFTHGIFVSVILDIEFCA